MTRNMGAELRALIPTEPPVMAPLCLEPLVGRLIEATGFKAGYVGGGALGFSLAEIREILELSHAGRSPCPRVRDIVRARAIENAARIEELARLQARIEQAARRWARMPDQAPNGPAICHLIEALGTEDA